MGESASVKRHVESTEGSFVKALQQLSRPLTEAFIYLFFLQLLTQQLFVRLSPYLFEVKPSSAVMAWSFTIGAVSTGAAAITGVGALLANGFVFTRTGNRGSVLVGAILMLVGVIVGVMNVTRALLGPTELSSYGLVLWELPTRMLLFASATLSITVGVVLSANPRGSVSLARFMRYVKNFSISSALLVMSAYLLIKSLIGIGVGGITITYNTAINFAGIAVASSAILSTQGLNRKIFTLSMLTGTMLSFTVAYVLYANYFISRIFEMTWQTSFGTPIPPAESVIYSFFLGFLFTAEVLASIFDKEFSKALPALGLIVFLSSAFLIGSLTVYFEAATLGYIAFVVPGVTDYLDAVKLSAVRSKDNSSRLFDS